MDEDGEVDSKQLRRQVREDCNVSWISDVYCLLDDLMGKQCVFPWENDA